MKGSLCGRVLGYMNQTLYKEGEKSFAEVKGLLR